MLGHWKNYDELEENLSIEELILTLKASRDREHRERKFLAAMQGVDLDENQEESEDVLELSNNRKSVQEGFGINEGLGFINLGV